MNINAPATKAGIFAFGGATNATLKVNEKATIQFKGGTVAIDMASDTSFINTGVTMTFDNSVGAAIRNNGDINNLASGTIQIEQVKDDGIISTLNFNNQGTIIINKVGDDAIEFGSSSAINKGIINIVLKDDAGFGNARILVDSLTRMISFSPMSLTADSAEIKTVYDFVLKVRNICDEVFISGVEDNLLSNVEVYPTLTQNGDIINIT